MNKKKYFIIIILFTLFFGCGDKSVDNSDDKIKVISVDCISGTAGCSEIIINGDLPYVFPNGDESPFSGYADPCIRKDPQSTTLWLAYSWPNYIFENNKAVPGVDIHLAKSIDNGKSWLFVKKLWNKEPITNPAKPNQQGYLDHETANILPVNFNGSITWFATRLNYFVPNDGGFSARPFNSYHISVMKANSTEGLTSAKTSIIGATETDDSWNPQRLVPPNLASAHFFWNEPALYFEDGKLYLIIVAFVYEGVVPAMAKNNIYVFSTTPAGEPDTWIWSYTGQLTDASISSELGGERLTQVEIAKDRNGNLLALLSPDDWNTTYNDFNHKGCKIIELESINPPKIKRDNSGNILVRAIITASDAGPLGSGASTYDPNSLTGVLFTKRIKTNTQLKASIWQTSIGL